MLGFDGYQQLGNVRRQPPGLAAVGARLGIEGIEAALPVVVQPVADGLGGDVGALGAGDGVLLLGLGLHHGADAGGAGREQ